MNVTIKYGSETLNKFFDGEEVSVATVLSNSTVKAALGYGDNVRALVNDVEVPNSSYVGDGDMIVVETRANTKARISEPQLEALATA